MSDTVGSRPVPAPSSWGARWEGVAHEQHRAASVLGGVGEGSIIVSSSRGVPLTVARRKLLEQLTGGGLGPRAVHAVVAKRFLGLPRGRHGFNGERSPWAYSVSVGSDGLP